MTDSRRKGGSNENDVAPAISDWAAPREDGVSWFEHPVSALPFRRRPPEAEALLSNWTGQRDLIHRPDVEFPFAIECKKVEGWSFDGMFSDKWEVWDWWAQTLAQATKHRLLPLLVFTRNRRPQYAMIQSGVFSWARLQLLSRPPSGFEAATRTMGTVGVLPLDELICAPLATLSSFLNGSAHPASKGAATACPPASSRTSLPRSSGTVPRPNPSGRA